ncbi:MAG: GGDEF domain-containing phosphodiesterase [Acholeplasmataceae bacterium]
MKKFAIKTGFLFGFIYLILIILTGGFYYYYSNDFSNSRALSYASKTHDLYDDQFNQTVNTDYLVFKEYVESYANVDELNLNLSQISSSYLTYVAIYEINSAGITIDHVFYEFSNPIYFEATYLSSLSFYKMSEVLKGVDDDMLYGVFHANGYIGIFEGNPYIHDIESSSNVVVMRKNGLFLATKKETTSNRLHSYISENTTSMFATYFSVGQSGTLLVTVNKVPQVMSFTPLELTNELYYVTFYNLDSAALKFQALDLFIVVGLVFILGLYVLTNILIFYMTAMRFTDIENARLKVYYNKRLMIKINYKGRVTGFNRYFKTAVPDYRLYKHVDNFIVDNPNEQLHLFERIQKLNDISLIFNQEKTVAIFRFVVVKMGLKYALIGINSVDESKDNQTYERLALTSEVTKLPNYNYFIQFFNDIIAKKGQIEANKYIIVGLNIVDFKGVNKLVGEKVANETLIELVRSIENNIKDDQYTLFNTFIDNFIIVFKKPKTLKEIELWTENLIDYVEASSSMSGSSMQLNIKAGIYEVDLIMGEQITSRQIYDRVMVAVKHASTQGAIKYAVYDIALRDMVLSKTRMEESLVNAVENDEFTMHLQPQYNMITERIESFEALIRWNNPNYNHVSPVEFIRVAEENNLIVHIGQMVMEETIKIAKQLEKYQVSVGMNISPVQMVQRGFVQQFETLIEKYDIKPHSIAVEITETFMVSSLQLVSDKLQSLRKMGIHIHLDDFGMGYSTLSYLKDLPIDVIKIDKNFIDNITTDKYSKGIVNMISSLSKTLNVGVIAEGVERDDQSKALIKAGISVIQGFIISKAVPFDEAVKLLEKYNHKSTKSNKEE